MANIITSTWTPNEYRTVSYQPKPEAIPDWLYSEALAAKKQYNEGWEFWVQDVANTHNITFGQAEIACIKGIDKACQNIKIQYGPRLGKWFIDFLEMESIFEKVKNLKVTSKGEIYG